jgi:hypothetical protein
MLLASYGLLRPDLAVGKIHEGRLSSPTIEVNVYSCSDHFRNPTNVTQFLNKEWVERTNENEDRNAEKKREGKK